MHIFVFAILYVKTNALLLPLGATPAQKSLLVTCLQPQPVLVQSSL